MITALLSLLYIVKPSGHLTQCLLYKTLHLSRSPYLVLLIANPNNNKILEENPTCTSQKITSLLNEAYTSVEPAGPSDLDRQAGLIL